MSSRRWTTSAEYHFYREHWLKTSAKHSRMLKYGIFPHHFAPRRVEMDWPAVYDELKSSIAEGLRRPKPQVFALRLPG